MLCFIREVADVFRSESYKDSDGQSYAEELPSYQTQLKSFTAARSVLNHYVGLIYGFIKALYECQKADRVGKQLLQITFVRNEDHCINILIRA